MSLQTCKDLQSGQHSMKTWSTTGFSHNGSKFLRLFEWDRPNPARISVPILVFMVLRGVQHCSGLTWTFTGKYSHLVVRCRFSPSCLGRRGTFLPSSFSPLPFPSPLGLALFVWLRCQLNTVPVVQSISASLGMSSCTTSRASVIILVRSQAVHSCSTLLFLHSCQHYCSTVTFCSHNICCLIVSKGNFLLRKFFWGFCLGFF